MVSSLFSTSEEEHVFLHRIEMITAKIQTKSLRRTCMNIR